MTHGIASIDTCKWIFLREIGEPADNELRLVVEEAVSGEPTVAPELAVDSVPGLREILATARPIVHETGCKIFEVVWPSYIAYSVRNESYVAADKSEVGKGRLFVEYSVSKYLEFVEAATFACPDFPGPFKHWGINCLNHIIDVVSTESPTITVKVRT